MDLAAVLNNTEPVECEFLNHTVTAHVYTAGALRLTKEQRVVLKAIGQTAEVETPDDEQLSVQVSEQLYNRNIDTARELIPIMIHRWDLDGSAMTYGEESLPPTPENMSRCPDLLIMEVALKAVEVWQRPTNGGRLLTGSPPVETENPQDSGSTMS